MLIGYRSQGSVLGLVAGIVLGWVVGFGLLFAIWPTITVSGAPWEHAWLMSAHATFTGGWQTASIWISALGYTTGVIIVMVLFVLYWIVRATAWKSAFLIVNGGLIWGIDHFAKNFFARSRPELFPQAVLDSFSYPSGHALVAAGFFGYIAYLLAREASLSARRIIWTVWVLFALAMGGSRIVIGVHWPSDVLAGYAAGAVFLLGMCWGTSRYRPLPRRTG